MQASAGLLLRKHCSSGVSKSALYEQARDLREVGAGVQISPNGTRVLYSLGLADAIRAVAVEPAGKEVRLWNSGATWPLFDLGPTCVARYGFPYLMFHSRRPADGARRGGPPCRSLPRSISAHR